MKLPFFAILCCISFASQALGQIVVEKEGSGVPQIDYSRFKSGSSTSQKLFLNTLKKDLEFSGELTEGRAGAIYWLGGTASPQAGGKLLVQIQLYRSGRTSPQFSQNYQARHDSVRALAHQVADDIVQSLTGKPGIASTRIALIGKQGRNKEIFVCDADGSNLRKVTNFGSTLGYPYWSPDGSSLFFTGWMKRFSTVYKANISQGGALEPIAQYSGLNTGGAVSPNGKEVALVLSYQGKPEIYVKNLENSRMVRITYTSNTPKSSPSWSPDGKKIVFTSGHAGRPSLYIVDRRSKATPRRIPTLNREDNSPDWGPDGRIAFSGRSRGQTHISVYDPTTGDLSIVSPQDGAHYEDPAWAPNGRHLACVRIQNNRSSIYILDTETKRAIPLIQASGDWVSPAWSKN